jgi:uncharacterized cupin superfamily protein
MTDTQPFTRIVANQDGGSSFADGEVSLSSQHIAAGTPPMLTGPIPSTAGVIYLRTGPFEGTPHPAPRKQWLVMLRGALRVSVTDGTSREFRAGDLLLLEDTSGTGHVQATVGDPPFEALFIPAP